MDLMTRPLTVLEKRYRNMVRVVIIRTFLLRYVSTFSTNIEAVRAIESFQVLDSKKAPEPSSVKPMAANLAHKLHEPHYWDGPDALNLFDIAGAHEALPSRKRRSLLWESKLSFCRQMM